MNNNNNNNNINVFISVNAPLTACILPVSVTGLIGHRSVFVFVHMTETLDDTDTEYTWYHTLTVTQTAHIEPGMRRIMVIGGCRSTV